jgi:hypothetical protein
MQLNRDGRDRDIDDESIDPEHELRGNHDRKHPPAARGIDGRYDDLVHGEASFRIPLHRSFADFGHPGDYLEGKRSRGLLADRVAWTLNVQ